MEGKYNPLWTLSPLYFPRLTGMMLQLFGVLVTILFPRPVYEQALGRDLS